MLRIVPVAVPQELSSFGTGIADLAEQVSGSPEGLAGVFLAAEAVEEPRPQDLQLGPLQRIARPGLQAAARGVEGLPGSDRVGKMSLRLGQGHESAGLEIGGRLLPVLLGIEAAGDRQRELGQVRGGPRLSEDEAARAVEKNPVQSPGLKTAVVADHHQPTLLGMSLEDRPLSLSELPLPGQPFLHLAYALAQPAEDFVVGLRIERLSLCLLHPGGGRENPAERCA